MNDINLLRLKNNPIELDYNTKRNTIEKEIERSNVQNLNNELICHFKYIKKFINF